MFAFFQAINVLKATIHLHPMMLPLRKMPPLKATMQASAAASKIKNKMLSEFVTSLYLHFYTVLDL